MSEYKQGDPGADEGVSIPVPRVSDRHVWEFAWVRDLIWITGFSLLLLLMYQARSILVPVLVALGLAYVFNPLITWMQRRWGWPRWAGVAGVFAVAALIGVNVLLLTIPPLVGQTRQLLRQTPAYLREGAERLHIDYDAWRAKVSQLARGASQENQAAPADEEVQAPQPESEARNEPDDNLVDDATELVEAQVEDAVESLDAGASADIPWQQIGQIVLRAVGVGFGVVSGMVGFVTYMLLALFITAFCFFFFTWHFQGVIDWFKTFIPAHSYDRTMHIVGRMDRTLSAFIRGRLVQSMVLGAVLSVGWWLAGVPYWLLLGLGCGVLNLIPYAAFVGWPIAVLLTWADTASGDRTMSIWAVAVWPSVVYLLGQSLDGWVVEPLVQGKATALDPLSVMLVVLIGATLAGVLGMLLAIPVAACGKIVAEELILPRLRSRVKPDGS